MEGRFVVTALIFSILAACSKQEIHQNSFEPASLVEQETVPPGIYSSEWENIPAWNAETSPDAIRFSYSRQLPDLKKVIGNGGLVLVFARNLWANDTVLKGMEDAPAKPLMMPFYFLPYFEKPNYTEQWNYTLGENKIDISLLVKGAEDAAVPGKKIQLRFIVLPGEIIKAKKQSVQTVRKLSYDQLVQTFGLAS